MRVPARGLITFFLVSVGIAGTVVIFAMVFGLLDIVASLADEQAGVLTGRAIRAVKAEREGSETIGELVAREMGDSHWSAVHDDDDSLLSVRVTALAHHPRQLQWAEWCVFYRLSPTAAYGLQVDVIIPASRTTQVLAPAVGKRLHVLPGGGPWSCTALRVYFGSAE